MRRIQKGPAWERWVTGAAYEDWFGDRFRSSALVREYEPGETLIDQGEAPGALLLLVKGRVRIGSTLSNGKRRILRTDAAPTLLGEMELLGVRSEALSVRALDRCCGVELPYEVCRRELLDDPAFLRRLCMFLGEKERKSTDEVFRTAGFPLENRLAHFLLEMREGDRIRLSKVEMADSLGVSYRHLSKVLSDLVGAGALSKAGRVYTIEREETLLALSAGLRDPL